MKAIFIALAAFSVIVSHAQSPEPAPSVNHFNGALQQTIPLITIPGKPAMEISATYSNNGIAVNAEAGSIGLGWDITDWQITRSVNGMPDDWNGKENGNFLETHEIKISDITGVTSLKARDSYYGALYFSNPGLYDDDDARMDTYQSSRGMEASVFEFPNYDDYFVSAPGFGGQMRPHLFDYASFHHASTIRNLFHNRATAQSDGGCEVFNPDVKPQFRFVNEASSQVGTPYYGSEEDKSFGMHSGEWNDRHHAHTFKTPNDLKNQDFTGDYSNGKIHEANYVEYFTNAQLDAGIEGFMEYADVDRGNDAKFDPDGIGAFRIYTASGLVYHFSLPVYNNVNSSYKETTTVFGLDFDLASGLYILENENEENQAPVPVKKFTKEHKYATAWKLTAITGQDFVDVNENGRVDAGDKGTWVSLDYSLWHNDFRYRSPYYGYHMDVKFRSVPRAVYRVNKETLPAKYDFEGSVSTGSTQLYYLNAIRTNTHTAFFVKDLKEDGFGVPETEGSSDPIPKLRLSHIILIDRKDEPLFTASNDLTHSDFDLTETDADSDNGTIHKYHYLDNKTAIDNAALKIVELTYDYSLCKKLHNNINSSFSLEDNIFYIGYPALFKTPVFDGVSDLNTGKLTLKSIRFIERNNRKIVPDFKFYYDEDITAKNPDFNHLASDVWGFHKSDFDNAARGKYTTYNSKDDVDAWSLKKIITPIGKEFTIEYESDVYERVVYEDGSNDKWRRPQRTFIASDLTFTDRNTVVMRMIDKDVNGFIEGYTNTNSAVSGLAVWAGFLIYLDCKDCSKNSFGWHRGSPSLTNDIDRKFSYNFLSNSYTIDGHLNDCSFSCGWEMDSKHSYPYISVDLDSAYGGGIRVKTISAKENESGSLYKTAYSYRGGTATSEPGKFDRVSPISFGVGENTQAYDKHVIPSGVGYGWVIEKNIGEQGKSNGQTEYAFTTSMNPYDPHVIFVATMGKHTWGEPCFSGIKEIIRVDDYTNLYGRLNRVVAKDINGNIINSVEKEYDWKAIEGGKVSEMFYRLAKGKVTDLGLGIDDAVNQYCRQGGDRASIFIMSRYTGLLTKEITIRNGLKTVTSYSDYDAFTGLPGRITVDDASIGTRIVENEYTYETYTDMGSKVLDEDNHNMLTELAVSKVMNEDEELIDGTRTEWRDNPLVRDYNATSDVYENNTVTTIWHPFKVYKFNGETDPDNWQLTTTTNLLDEYFKPIESKTVKGLFSADKYGYNYKRHKIASVANCNYASFTYTGFEHTEIKEEGSPDIVHFDGEVGNGELQDIGTSTIRPHTGNFMAKIAANTTGAGYIMKYNSTTPEQGLMRDRIYRASVWVHEDSPSGAALVASLDGEKVGGLDTISRFKSMNKSQATVHVGDWYLLTIDIDVPANYLSSGGHYSQNDLRVYLSCPSGGVDAYFDDLMLHPIDAPISAYVYNDKGLVTHQINNENFYTRNVYDAADRLITTYIETEDGEKRVSETRYNFARNPSE